MATNSYNYQEITYICTQTCVNTFNFSFELIGLLLMMTSTHFNELSSNQKENLHKREELIQKIKDLIVVDENSNKLYSKFKLLKEEWHNVGQVPITDRNNIY